MQIYSLKEPGKIRKLAFDFADEQHKYDRFSDDRFTLEILSHSFQI